MDQPDNADFLTVWLCYASLECGLPGIGVFAPHQADRVLCQRSFLKRRHITFLVSLSAATICVGILWILSYSSQGGAMRCRLGKTSISLRNHYGAIECILVRERDMPDVWVDSGGISEFQNGRLADGKSLARLRSGTSRFQYMRFSFQRRFGGFVWQLSHRTDFERDWGFVTILALPHWFLVTLSIIATYFCAGRYLLHSLRLSRRLIRGRCPNCGYDLRATPARCPECGRTVDKHHFQGMERGREPMPRS